MVRRGGTAGAVAVMVAALLSSIGASTASAATACHPYPDVTSANSACGNITWLKGQDITKPADGLYHPTNSVTRGSMAAFLFRMVTPGASSPTCRTRPFPDVPTSSMFCGYIAWAKNNHVAYGYPDGTYGPDNPVTRGAMAAYLHRITTDKRTPTCHHRPFTDVPVDSTFCGVITWMKNNGITYGVGDGKYGTTLPVTRQAMASFLHRIYDLRATTHPNKITYKTITKDTTIPQPATKHVADASMYVGQSKTVQRGHPSTLRTTYKQKYVNGAKSGHPVKTGSKTVKAAVATVIHEGTKEKPVTWINDPDLAASTFAAVNAWRADHGLPAFGSSASCSESTTISYAKTQSGGCGLSAWGYTTGSAALQGWVNDPPHLVILKTTDFTQLGCTAVRSSDDMVVAISCAIG